MIKFRYTKFLSWPAGKKIPRTLAEIRFTSNETADCYVFIYREQARGSEVKGAKKGAKIQAR